MTTVTRLSPPKLGLITVLVSWAVGTDEVGHAQSAGRPLSPRVYRTNDEMEPMNWSLGAPRAFIPYAPVFLPRAHSARVCTPTRTHTHTVHPTPHTPHLFGEPA